MKTMKQHRRLLGILAILVTAAVTTTALVSYRAGKAGASGIPKQEPLMYAGLLLDKAGKPLTGSHTLKVAMWDKQTGGTQLCASSTATKDLTKTAGRFRISLPNACVGVVHKTPETWVEVTADGGALPRTMVGAVPYAVEANRVAEMACPPGYERDASATGIVLCMRGKDEMVKVGTYWVDRYEASLVDTNTYNSGTCNGSGGKCGSSSTGQCGVGVSDDYPLTFPDSGNWSTKVYACSVSGNTPSRNMTWFQAQQACLLAGKRLCTNGEWQGAAAGTYDPGKYNGSGGGSCHTGGTSPRKTGQAGKVPGASASCISRWGAEDMIGNMSEWVDIWWQVGQASSGSFANDKMFKPWPSNFGDGKDFSMNINGKAGNPHITTTGSTHGDGAPGAAIRGGSRDGEAAGVFVISVRYGPAFYNQGIATRCCR